MGEAKLTMNGYGGFLPSLTTRVMILMGDQQWFLLLMGIVWKAEEVLK